MINLFRKEAVRKGNYYLNKAVNQKNWKEYKEAIESFKTALDYFPKDYKRYKQAVYYLEETKKILRKRESESKLQCQTLL